MKRPMLYWVVLFVLGEVLYGRIPVAWIVLLMIFYIIFICAWNNDYVIANRRLLFLGVLFFSFGAVCTGYRKEMLDRYSLSLGDTVEFRGIVTDVEQGEDNEYRIKLSSINGEYISTYILIEYGEYILPGAEVAGYGEYSPYMEASNPGQYSEKEYRIGRGELFKLDNVHITSVRSGIISVRRLLWRVRNYCSYIYGVYLNDKDASLARAMVLGEKSSIDSEIRQLYRRNGIAHLIAISGLHIAMLGGTLYHIVRRCLGSYMISAFIGSTFIIMYGIMTGLSGATLRAMIMLIVALGADVMGRRYDAVTSISLALLVMLVNNPLQLGQAGFLLSFGAVIGIACVFPAINELYKDHLPKAASKAVDGLCVSVSVQLVISPILLYYFYEIPVYSILINIIVVPLMSVLLAVLITLGTIGGLNYHAAIAVAYPATWIFRLYEILCKLTEKLPGHTLCLGRPGHVWMLVYYILLALGILLLYRKRLRYSLMAAALWCMLWTVFLVPGKLKICMFDVGQGDGIYIRTPDRQNILIDGGSSSKSKIGTYILSNGIKYHGAGTIDYMIITHSDKDHYSGALELLESSDICVVNLVLPAISNPDDAYKALEVAALNKGCRLHYIGRGDRLVVGEVSFTCLNPDRRMYADKNEGSIVFWLQYESFDMLFTGDIDSVVEDELIRNEMLATSLETGNRMEVLKVAHHGSKTSSSETFLRYMDFDTALVSVADRNRYGHPAPETLERLEAFCEQIYLTKESGAITIETDGKSYGIREFADNENNNAGY